MITLSTFGLRESERERLFVGRREMKIQEMRRSRESSIWFGEKKRERERESFCWSLEPGAWSWYAILCILCPYNQSSFAGSMSPPYPNTPKPNISISSPFHVLSLSLSLSLKKKKKTNKNIFRKQFEQGQTLLCKNFSICFPILLHGRVSKGKS
jgi:hypothetical protein